MQPLTLNVEVNYFVKVIKSCEMLLFSNINSNESFWSRVIETILSDVRKKKREKEGQIDNSNTISN